MRKILLGLLLSVFTLLTCVTVSDAQGLIGKADREFELFNYIKAIKLYEEAYKKKADFYPAHRLAEAYTLIKDYKQAESWYAIVVKMPASKALDTLNYAKALQSNAKYSEAKMQYQSYLRNNKQINLTQQNIWLASCDSAIKWMKNPEKVEVINEKALNSPQYDWAPVAYGNGVVFTSDRNDVEVKVKKSKPFLKFDGTIWPDKNVYGWTGNGYLRLYFKSNTSDSITLFPVSAGTDYHIGASSFSADGNTIFFTLTRIPKKLKTVKGKPSTIRVELFSSTKNNNGEWAKAVPFAYNDVNNYSVGDPFLTADGKTLYFVSDMPGSLGGTDIYRSDLANDGSWTKPVNVANVNTEGNERSPVLNANGDFYFSTDGRVGMGGLDIFKGRMVDGKVEDIANLRYPFNSPQDDFGFSLNEKGTLLYLSSNREEGLGEDDIYRLKSAPKISLKLVGRVLNRRTNLPVGNSTAVLSKVDGGILKFETAEDSKYSFDLSPNSDYTVAGIKTGFLSEVKDFTTKGINGSIVIEKDLYVDVIELNKAIRIENIYYDFDKWNIRPDAAVELDKLVKILKDNPTIWIELGSHTDSRGKDAYNLNLSQKRAESAVDYIVSRGIDRNRITARGYGETQLLNRCSNGVECTEEEHQLNRRTEFKIVKY